MSMPQPPAPPPFQSATETACYRHPDRAAWRRCTRCGRPACNECLVQAPVGSHCLECAKQSRPTASFKARAWNARQITLVTYALMAINVAVFVWIAADSSDAVSGRNLVSQRQYDIGLAEGFLARDEWYRLLSSGFLHFGIFHLLLNMFLLFQLGQLLEPMIGRIRFGLLYLAALLGGSAGAMLLQPDGFHGGASGAVFGLMGAAFVALRHQGINPFSTGLGMMLIINLVFTFSIPGISIGGHLGGVVAGAAAGFVMFAPRWKVPEWATYVTPVAVALVAVVATVVVVQI